MHKGLAQQAAGSDSQRRSAVARGTAAALGCWPVNHMGSERRLILTFPRKRHGAGLVARVAGRAIFTGASRPVSSLLASARSAALLPPGRVASLRARLRLAALGSVRVVSAPAATHGVAVRLVSAGLRHARLFLLPRLPNNSLVPTLEGNATHLCVGGGAAQLYRYTRENH